MNDILTILAPFIVAINAILLLVTEIITERQENKENKEYKEIKEKWKGVS